MRDEARAVRGGHDPASAGEAPPAGANTAKIVLGPGVDEKVGWLFYGSKMQRVGTYGSTDSAAVHQDNTHFTGPGILTVLHDNSGTMISVR
mgnify:CR=1 FL=1